jgi:hypothetical protein
VARTQPRSDLARLVRQQVIEQFAAMGRGITARAGIGEHIEWYYLDTEPAFKCVIESGSGHALDFMKPDGIYPEPPVP